MAIEFTCPKCKKHRIEIVENPDFISSEIIDLEEDGECVLQFIEAHGSEMYRIQCLACGYVIQNENGENIIDMFELVEWIQNQPKK